MVWINGVWWKVKRCRNADCRREFLGNKSKVFCCKACGTPDWRRRYVQCHGSAYTTDWMHNRTKRMRRPMVEPRYR